MRSAVVRFALLLAVAVVVVAVWTLVLDGDEEQEDVSAPTRLYTVPQDEIMSVTVRTETARVAFERGNEGWRFADAPLVPVNLDRWGGIVLLLSGPEVERLLAPPSNLDQFGLDSPSAISIGLIDGRQVEVRLGAGDAGRSQRLRATGGRIRSGAGQRAMGARAVAPRCRSAASVLVLPCRPGARSHL